MSNLRERNSRGRGHHCCRRRSSASWLRRRTNQRRPTALQHVGVDGRSQPDGNGRSPARTVASEGVFSVSLQERTGNAGAHLHPRHQASQMQASSRRCSHLLAAPRTLLLLPRGGRRTQSSTERRVGAFGKPMRCVVACSPWRCPTDAPSPGTRVRRCGTSTAG